MKGASKRVLAMMVVAILIALGSGTIAAANAPEIRITTVPAYGSTQNLQGEVLYADPTTHHVVCYIFLEGVGWWVKPTTGDPCTTINTDGTWSAVVKAGPCDEYATKYACYLLPLSESCPIAEGTAVPPPVLDSVALDWDLAERTPYPIDFSGHTWQRKESICGAGPGPNQFDPGNVWEDLNGQLHLAINHDGSHWQCAELFLEESLGYGEYRVHITGRVDQLDPQMVLGFFTWDPWAPDYFREMDFEVSRWGQPLSYENAQFAVQPYWVPGNLDDFRIGLTDSNPHLTYLMNWKSGVVEFSVYRGHHFGNPPGTDLIVSWSYSGVWLPAPGQETFRMNLWLYEGLDPVGGAGDEVIVTYFGFAPRPDFNQRAYLRPNDR